MEVDPAPGGDGPQDPAPPPAGPAADDGPGGLVGQATRAGRGVWALLRASPDWPKWFELTSDGFLRSFYAPLLALPLYVFGSALVSRALLQGREVPGSLLWAAGGAHLIDALGFPLLIALIARPLGMAAGYAAFVIVTNWASLYLNLLLAAFALLALDGQDGLEAFSLMTLVLLCLSVLFIWRAGRLMLSREVAPVLLVVVLSVAVSAGADEVAQLFA